MLLLGECETGEDERPLTLQKILQAEILNNPFADIMPREKKKEKTKKEKTKEKKTVKKLVYEFFFSVLFGIVFSSFLIDFLSILRVCAPFLIIIMN